MATFFPTYNLAGYAIVPYNGVLVGKNVSICSTPNHQSKILSAIADWGIYTTGAISININSVGTAQPLDRLVGVWIDNSNNLNTVLINIPDTGQNIVCEGRATVFAPIFSTTNIAVIYSLAPLVNAGFTTVLFTNFVVDDYVNTTSNIVEMYGLVANTSGGVLFQPFVLGNLQYGQNISLTSVNDVVFLGTVSTGRFIITNINITIQGGYNTFGTSSGNLAINDSTAGGTVKLWPYIMRSDLSLYSPFTLFSHDGEYLTLDATHLYFLHNNVACSAGTALVDISYIFTTAN